MQMLVTGGAGFIGSHLVEALLERRHDVLVIDNFATGRKENLPLEGAPNLRIVEADIANPFALSGLFDGIDVVFHLAALADIVPSISDPLAYHRTNVDGTMAVLEAARATGVRRFMYAASSSCYGIPDVFPTPETAPIRPQYPYALTKYVGECYALHWGQVYGMSCTALRLFNVYGPRARTSGAYGAVFGVFLAQKLAGKPFTVVGDGTQTRDFTYVTDVVEAFIRAAEVDVSGEAINIGSGGTYSVNRIVELLGGPAVHIPKRPGEPDCTFADITKAERLLNWRPSVPFEEGVRRILADIERWRNAPVWTPESIEQATRDWFTYLNAAGAGGTTPAGEPVRGAPR